MNAIGKRLEWGWRGGLFRGRLGYGDPFDGQWFDLGSYAIEPIHEMLAPGAAYYYLRRGEETQVEF